MKPKLREFPQRLERQALHIDYLRIRCGRERTFEQQIMDAHPTVGAHIAFSEWDVVLFAPSNELYPASLTAIYSDRVIADTIAGCTGYFNYLWQHDINRNWQARLLEREPTIALLVSLRFTDRFRAMFGIFAELLFCNFLKTTLGGRDLRYVEAIVAHSVGWNDATVILKAKKTHEERLVDALTAIRYATERQVIRDSAATDAGIIAATYSHVIGNLRAYRDKKLSFGSFRNSVKAARLLIRVNPDMEVGMRRTLGTLVEHHHGGVDVIGSELGHYNFSANISSAFHSTAQEPVQIIQGFREAIRDYMEQHERRDEMSFPETTTEITFKEPKVEKRRTRRYPKPTPSPIPSMAALYKTMIQRFLNKELKRLDERASSMTRHRLAVLLVTVLTYLDDPVRGSVVGHLCRFLRENFKEALTRSDRSGKDDLCHVLEYALHQATDGLNQFQHDANSLGLSGRGGYNRLIHAVEEFSRQITCEFDKQLTPLITFGLRPSADESILDYWLDVPFSTAFNIDRWHIVLHDLARLAWLKTFEWRLESYDVWQVASRSVFPLPSQGRQKRESRRSQEEQRRLVLLGRDVLGDVFPSYALLHLVAGGDLEILDDLMIAREFMTKSHPLLIDSVVSQVVLHVLLDLHAHLPRKPAQRRSTKGHGRHEAYVRTAFDWWEGWVALREEGRHSSEFDRRLGHAVTQATSSLSRSLMQAKRRFPERDVAGTLSATAELIKTTTFKEPARRNVKGVIDLLAKLGEGYAKRHRQSFEAYDPSAVAFGQMLRAIERMQQSAQVPKSEMEAYRQSIEAGTVYALGPQASSVATFLAATESHSESKSYGRLMIASLSSILSLWHSAVTHLGGVDQAELLRRLEKAKVLDKT